MRHLPICAILLLLTIPHLAHAQDSVPAVVGISNRTGDVPYSAQIGSQFEHVELSSGNLIVEIPFLNLPERGMSFDYGIRYDAAYWLIQNEGSGTGTLPYWNPEMRNWLTNSTLGWTSTQPYETYTLGQMSCYSGASKPQTGGGNNSPVVFIQGARADSAIFTDRQGTKHQILVNYQSNGECSSGSYSFMNQQGPSAGQDGFWGQGWGGTVIGPDGATYAAGGTSGGISYPNQYALPNQYFLDMAKVTDTRGNTQLVSPGGTDTVGRTPITLQTTGNQMVYTVTDSNGNPQTYTVNLENIAINTAFDYNLAQVSEYQKTRTTVSSVVLPNLQSYGFTYDSYGDITKITLPTGGYVSYTWANFTNVSSASSAVGIIRAVTSRTVNDGVSSQTWNITYAPVASPSGCAEYTTTLTSPPDPQGTEHTTVYTYGSVGGPNVLCNVQYDLAGDGSYLRGYQMSYYQAPSFGGAVSTPIDATNLLQSITTTLNAGSGGSGGTVSRKEFDYDTFGFERYDADCTSPSEESACELSAQSPPWPPTSIDILSHGNVTAIREYAAGTGSAGSLIRQTIRKYLQDYTAGYGMTPQTPTPPLYRINYTGVNIVNKAIDESIYDGSATCTGTGSINYTTGAYIPPAACGAVKLSERTLQYDNQNPSSYGYHGEETALVSWLNSPSSNLTTTYVHDSFGNLTSVTDPKGYTTTIGYGDSFAPGISTCSIQSNSSVYPTSITNALSQKRQLSYYGCTGKLSQSQDANDLAASPVRAGTTYTYEEMGRLHTQTMSDGGSITKNYNDEYPVTTTTSKAITSSITQTTIETLDGLGREITSELESDPYGPIYTEKTYDALGRPYTVTNPYRSTTDTSYGITTTLYDGIGRPVSVTNPDGTIRTTSYSGNAVTSKDENGNQWLRTSDALGRLTQVMEPNGTSTSPTMETDYTYDPLNNLKSVAQLGVSGTDTPRTNRSFNYDSLSRLTSAFNIESGTTTYLYDNNGNLTTKTEPAINGASGTQTIGYCYDALNRPTYKFYSGSFNCSTPSGYAESYAYDTSSLSGTVNTVGRLTDERSYIAGTLTSERSPYQYDSEGRLTAEQQIPYSPSPTSYNFLYAYDLAGDPTCTNNGFATVTALSTCPNYTAQANSITASYTYDAAGRLGTVGTGTCPGSGCNNIYTATNYGPAGILNANYGDSYSLARYYDNRMHLMDHDVYSTSGTFGQATVTISGSEQTGDSGTVSITAGGYKMSVPYGANSTPASIATALVAVINQYQNSPVSATSLGGTVTLTALEPSGGGDASLSAVATDAGSSGPSFTATASGVALTGGGGNVAYRYKLTYQSNGNIATSIDQVNGNATYYYDTLNRLVSSSRANEGKINGTTYQYQCWGYDGFGNRIYELENQSTNCPSPALTSSQVKSYSPPTGSMYNSTTVGANNQVTFTTINSASGGFTYDLAGNVTSDHVINYVYDQEGRICAVQNTTTGSKTQYVYDAEGRRVAKGTIASWPSGSNTCAAPTTANGFTLTNVYLRGLHGDQDTELNTASGSLAFAHTNVYVNGEVTATWWNSSAGWEWSYTFSDWLGTKRIQVNPNSQAENVWQSDPYGDYMTPIVAGTDATEHHFTGKEKDAETATGPLNTGNDYFGARYYASTMGRFMSPDWYPGPAPIPYANIFDPQTLNLYIYAGNNPLSRFDADGHNWFTQFLQGLADSTYRPIVHIVEHPIATAQGIGTAIVHPIVTGRAIGTAIKDTVVAAAHGDGRAIGQIVGTAITSVAVAGAVSKGVGLLGQLGADAGGFVGETTSVTTEETVYFHYGYAADEAKFANGLRPGSFATTTGDLTGAEAKSSLALPNPNAPDSVYQVTPGVGTPVNGPSTVEPAFGQPGGGQEVTFPQGTGPGTVGPATPIPPQ